MGRSLTPTFMPIFIFFILFNIFEFSHAVPLYKYQVKIFDNILPKTSAALTLHCASKDDDFGNRSLTSGQDLHWRFKSNFWGTTRFFCHFWWQNKQNGFDVFYDGWSEFCDDPYGSIHDLNTCYWEIRADGFYFKNVLHNSTLERKYVWN